MRPRPAGPRIHAHLPLRELDKLAVGQEVSWWQDWVGHGEPTDPWWAKVDHSAGVADVAVPAAMIGGWRDIFLPWQVKDFEAMQARGREVWLTIGPWSHAALGGAAESVRQGLDLFSTHSHGSRPFAGRDRVRLYVMGADTWRDYSRWPPPDSRQERLFLQPTSQLSPTAPSAASDPTVFIYDPSDPTPAVHGPTLMGGARTPDMSSLERRTDTVAFTSAALSSDMEAIGPVRVELHVRSDRPHTDFYACLCDVDGAGRPLHVADGYLRLRPGDPPQDAEGVRRVSIECWPVAYRFTRGHRLRLIVASGAHPRYARNLGTGEPLGTGTRMLVARQEIFHDSAHTSALWVTLGAPQDKLPA
jgi:putative CocE/NonD family hydrolase